MPAIAPALTTVRFQGMREALLVAAVRQFNAQGVRGATLGDIAASVGLVTTSLTYYYRKKEDLATACFLRAIAAYDSLATDAAAAPDVPTRVLCFFDGLARWLADIEAGRRPPLMMFSDIRALPEAQAVTVFTAYTDLFRRLRALLVGPATAALSRDDFNARAHLLLSAANWLRGAIHYHEADTYPRVAAQVADILLHGLAAPGQPGPVDAAAAAVVVNGADGADGIGRSADRAANAGDDTADAFLRAATELVNEQGYRGASVDRISARLNLTKGAFYHHHENKLDLIAACFERSFAVQRQVLQAAGQAPGSGWARSCTAAAALVQFQLSPRGPLLRITATSALPDEAHRAQVWRSLQRLNERFAGLLVDGLVDGSIRPLHPTIAAQLLAANLNAAAELRRWVRGIQPASVTRCYTRPALLGLLCGA